MIHSIAQPALQIFIVVMAFQGPSGDRHMERMQYAFTTIDRCEEYARPVLKKFHRRIPGLYWWCEEVQVNP